jgi:hypothetical protein
MVKSKATTVEEYLASLPEERRAVMAAVRKVIRRHLPKGYDEVMNWGMISYEVPFKLYPDTPNGQPLSYLGLAAQKNHYALYAVCVCSETKPGSWLKEEFAKAGKKLDMGTSCIRFKMLDDLPLDAIAKLVAIATPEQFIKFFEAARNSRPARKG